MRHSRTLVTDQTRRNQGTNRAVLAALVILTLVGTSIYTWPQTSQMIDDGLLLGITGGIALVGSMVVAIMLYLRPEPLVADAPKGMSRVETRFMRRLHRRWARDTRAAGLTRDEPLDDGTIYVDAPRITSIERVALGLKMNVRVVAGISADQFITAAPGLASAVGSDLRARKIDAGNVEVIAELRDALAGVRAARQENTNHVVIGRKDDGTDAGIDLRKGSHIVVQGQTGSGKSALCYTLLSQASLADDVRVGGIDPNRVLLSPLAEAHGSAQFVLGADPDAAVDLLNAYVEQMDERIQMLDEAGVDNLSDFDRVTPIEVIVLEEYAALLRQADDQDRADKPRGNRAASIKRSVGRLVSEGRKAGMRVLMIIQRADADLIDGYTRGQMGTRITMSVDNGDAVRMLHPNLTPEDAERVTRFTPGRCLFWQDKETSTVQGDLCTYDEYRTRLGLGLGHNTNGEMTHADPNPAH